MHVCMRMYMQTLVALLISDEELNCMYVCMCMYACACVCMCVCVCIYADLQAHVDKEDDVEQPVDQKPAVDPRSDANDGCEEARLEPVAHTMHMSQLVHSMHAHR